MIRLSSGRALPVLAVLVVACRGEQPASDRPERATAPEQTRVVEGFSTPESVLHDSARDVWYVSNIDGVPSTKDGNGFISRLRSDGTIDSLRFIVGGMHGVTLHAPKGMAISGDTLWVTDIDAVRGFDATTGAPVATIDFGTQAVFLNDLVVGPDGALYVTDTGIRIEGDGTISHPGPDRVFRVRVGGDIAVVFEGDLLERPNGITWDPVARRFLLVPFGGTTLRAWAPGDSATTVLGAGPGMQDGVEVLADGRIVVSSWADSTLFVVGDTTRIRGVPNPADLGLDRARGVLAVPLFSANRVEFWRVP